MTTRVSLKKGYFKVTVYITSSDDGQSSDEDGREKIEAGEGDHINHTNRRQLLAEKKT